MDWASAPAFGRRATLLEALQKLHALQPGLACIVETGTLRDESERAREGDGWSTVAFGWYAQQTGGRVYTVDNDPAALETCKRLTAPYATSIEFVCADSLAFLREWNVEARGPIDLLYLDSLDYHEPERSEMHQLAEAQAALPALAPCCLILLDDTHPAGDPEPNGMPPLRGKGARAVPFLVGHGFRLEGCAGGQVLLSRGAERLNRGDAERGGQKDHLPVPKRPVRSQTDLVPLCEVERHLETVCRSPLMQEYLATVLRLARGGRTCEVGIEEGYGAIWLSRQGVQAQGIGRPARIRARSATPTPSRRIARQRFASSCVSVRFL